MRRSRAPKSVSSHPHHPPPPPGHPSHLPLNSGHSLESTAAAERLADYSRDSPLLGSPETDSGSESLKAPLSIAMPEAAAQDSHLAALTSSFKDKMKLEKVRGSVSGGAGSSGQANTSTRQHSSQEFDQKKVTVQVGEKYNGDRQSSKKRIPSANLDIPRAFLSCRE